MQSPRFGSRAVAHGALTPVSPAVRLFVIVAAGLTVGTATVLGVYWTLSRILGGPLGTTTVTPVHAIPVLTLVAILLVFACVYWPSITPSSAAELARAAAVVMATSIVAFGLARLGNTSGFDGGAMLVFPFVVVLAAVARIVWIRRSNGTQGLLLTSVDAAVPTVEEHGTLGAVMRAVARRAVIAAGVEGCRLFTVSSDGGALVLRGEASRETLAQAEHASQQRRERLPVQQLPWLDRLLQRDDWLHVPAEVVAIGGMGDELTRTLSIAGGRGAVSMRHLRTVDGPVGVICVVHRPGEAAASRARQLAAIDREVSGARARIERALHLRALGINGLGWWGAFRDLPYAVAVVNRGARVVAINHEAERELSTGAESLVGQRLCPGDDACTCPLHATLRTGAPNQVSLRSIWHLPTAPLGLGARSVNIWPITDPAGFPQFAVVALGSQAGANPAPLLGTEVAAMISHELRAPLATLRASSELALEEDTDPEDQRRLLTTISRQVDRLDAMVQDLADIFRLQAGQLQLKREHLDVPRLCRALADELRESGCTHAIVVNAADIGGTVAADRLKVRTVLGNLVGNAVKYAPPGSTVTIAVESLEDGLQISVEDEGPGIDPGDLPHVFEQFYRASATASTTKGYGLGLYITRSLVELHGGRIALENRPEAGCRATFTLPHAAAEPPIVLKRAV